MIINIFPNKNWKSMDVINQKNSFFISLSDKTK